MLQKHNRCTCRGCPQDHWLSSGNAQVPDSIPVAHILLEQLAQSSRSCGGFKAGHNLSREDGEKSIREPLLQPQIKDGCILNTILVKEISAALCPNYCFPLLATAQNLSDRFGSSVIKSP